MNGSVTPSQVLDKINLDNALNNTTTTSRNLLTLSSKSEAGELITGLLLRCAPDGQGVPPLDCDILSYNHRYYNSKYIGFQKSRGLQGWCSVSTLYLYWHRRFTSSIEIVR